MWADMLESSLWCRHWKGFVVWGTNKHEIKGGMGYVSKIIGIYDVIGFGNIMF